MTAVAETLDFRELSRALKRQVDDSLDRYSQFGPGCPARLATAIRHSLLAPGKRLRPILVLMSAQACGYGGAGALSAACAVEMVHTYSLIHDDLPAMDDDDLRRGLPSCHAKFGEATAILAGDALLALAFEVLASGVQPELAARCCAELARAAGAMNLVGGQEDDLSAEFSKLGIDELVGIHRRKTGALIRASLRLGGIVSGADERQLAGLDSYGENLGLAFQIVDDLLDLEGDEGALGKRAGKDSDHGKLTFPAVLGVSESRRWAEHQIADAIAALAPFAERGAGLAALARYVLERNH